MGDNADTGFNAGGFGDKPFGVGEGAENVSALLVDVV